MNQEQFKAFWIQLKAPLKAKWERLRMRIFWRSGQSEHVHVRAGEALWPNPRMARSTPGPTDAIPLVRELY